MFDTIKNIIIGNYNWFIYKQYRKHQKRYEHIFTKRFDMCSKCEFQKLSGTNILCSICHCPITSKTRVPYKLDKDGKSIKGCPKKFW